MEKHLDTEPMNFRGLHQAPSEFLTGGGCCGLCYSMLNKISQAEHVRGFIAGRARREKRAAGEEEAGENVERGWT